MLIHVKYQLQLMSRVFSCAVVSYVLGRERLLKSGLKQDPVPEEILFVVNASGLDTVDEITQARAALYH